MTKRKFRKQCEELIRKMLDENAELEILATTVSSLDEREQSQRLIKSNKTLIAMINDLIINKVETTL